MRPMDLRRRVVAAAAALITVASFEVAGASSASRSHAPHDAPAGCAPRLLVLSAFPTELGPLLDRSEPPGGNAVPVGKRTFYLGDLAGHRVVMALTGIGPVNAHDTTRLAISHFRCDGHTTITGIVFSGVAGGDYIGDVNAATRWTEDGKHYIPISPAMERVARAMQRDRRYHVSRHATAPNLPLPAVAGSLWTMVRRSP